MKLSIITVNRNDAEGLEKTIKSVVEQTFRDFEHIIIDGNSTDKSVEVIKKYESHINYWISEPDTGIYNAMNKGIKKASGEYCLFLNSGDYLYELTSLEKVFEETFDIDIIYCDIFLFKNDSFSVSTYPNKLTAGYLWGNTLAHQSAFIRLYLFEVIGFYNEKIFITADHDFFQKALCLYSASYIHLPICISVFNMNGLCSDPLNKQTIRDELRLTFKTNLPFFYDDYLKFNLINEDSLINFYQKNKKNKFLILTLKVIRKLFYLFKVTA